MRPKIFTKDEISKAMKFTKSNKAAARYLGCSYQHYKKYAKLYTNEEGKTFFDIHLNRYGKGIPKHLKGSKKQPALDSILNGELDPSHFTPEKIKNRLIYEAYIIDECNLCKMNERRITDYKIPLLLNFKDGNKKNYKLENLELLCYNCFFLHVADPFTPEQINAIEDFQTNQFKVEKIDWELDSYMLDNMKELGLNF